MSVKSRKCQSEKIQSDLTGFNTGTEMKRNCNRQAPYQSNDARSAATPSLRGIRSASVNLRITTVMTMIIIQ